MSDGLVPSGAGPSPFCAGLVLAAGSGSRLGRPKGLLRRPDGTPFVAYAVSTLTAGGAGFVTVVVGASGRAVSDLIPPGSAGYVKAGDWETGMGASLRTGLRSVAGLPGAEAVVVSLVDTPGVTAAAVRRLVRLSSPTALARCAYDGVPGHPVLLGRDHWAGVLETAHGDAGARAYLRGRDVTLVEVGDVAEGTDVDTREQYVRWSGDR